MSECSICTTNESIRLGGKTKLVSFITIDSVITQSLKAKANINTKNIQQLSLLKCKVSSISKINTKPTLSQNTLALKSSDNARIIRPNLQLNGILRSKASSVSKINNKYTDKFSGHISKLLSISNFASVQKLYPIKDKITSLNNSYFVNKYLSSGNLYDSIDEGVFTGNYNEHLNQSYRISDDNISYIQPSSIFTSGTFRYKCEVNRPYHHPKESFLFIRAAAPLSNYGANVPPEYRIHNIKLEDPSGNLIIRYKDITLRGDADYGDQKTLNYVTYISEPELNNANLHTWEQDYPILSEPSGYTLNMDFDIICLDDPFDIGFNVGYEERACALKFIDTSDNDHLSLDGSPLSTQTQGYNLNPTNTIRISAIEICNSGDLCQTCSISGIKKDNKFNFYTEVNPVGKRLSRIIYPSEMMINNQNIQIYPEVYSTWESSPNLQSIVDYNTSISGSQVLTSRINSDEKSDFIKLINSTPLSDSGRLTLKFNHKQPRTYGQFSNGAFDFSSSKEFNRADYINTGETDNFFTVDDIELRVVIKKANNSRDFVLDVVGYSDDKLLNVTPKIGAFLQNKHEIYYITDENDNFLVTENNDFIVTQNESLGNVPQISGFKRINDLALSSESISEKESYFKNYLTSIDAGDHYKLSTLPIISSTSFKEYTIPLSIYEDYVDVGKPKDYSMSSYFENLYIDLYPIPSGAEIASIKLIVYYKPSNGMSLHTFGTPSTKELGKKSVKLLPTGRDKSSDILLNSDISNAKLSIISGIPQAYSEPLTLKTNYSRRWRGVDGNIVSGPYDVTQFDFSFYNPEVNHPFLDGYFNLNYSSGNYILSNDYAYSGYYNGSSNILKNIGLRFNNTQLFDITTSYTTIDWTQNGNPIYGKISDAYDSAIRVSGQYGNINFGNKNISNGFAIYGRFTPDQSISGVGYNLFNSGVLISKWDNGKNLELALGFKNGYLSLLARDTNNNIVELNDTSLYSDYQYPLSVVATYIPGSPSGQLRLYCNNELSTGLHLRDVDNIILGTGDSNLIIGHSYGSGIGINAFIHEIGISTSGNLVHSAPNRTLKQTTVDSFLDGHSHTFLHNTTNNNKFKLHQYINNDTSLWKIGDFKICAFSPDFDGFTTRIGKDYIIHTLKHHGSGYSQVTNLPLPSSINASGLSYHSQIENDFIRFNLQDMPDANPEFYSASPRICKTLPRNYNFVENALVVDTVIEHETKNNILWNDGSIGPKLIVSLYSKNQDPVDRPSKKNWGLINRSIHYLKPSGCYEKLSSKFTYNDLIDISEPWALFDLDNITSEFDHKYYSTDINDMFLQYDLVYPSGSAFESTIKIHSANVRLDDALVYWNDNNNQLNLYASGEAIKFTNINLCTVGLDSIHESGLIIYTSGSPWPTSNNQINLSVSGIYGVPVSNFNLFVKNSGIVSSFSPDLYVLGGNPRDDKSLPLIIVNDPQDQKVYNSIPLFVNNKQPVIIDDILSLSVLQSYSAIELGKNNNVNLFLSNSEILVDNTSNNLNLYINTDIEYKALEETFTLYTINYLAYNQQVNQQANISWNENNVGVSIDPILDADVPYLEANDEIRGVDLICYGNCEVGDNRCTEKSVILHDTVWYNDDCVDGGIFSIQNTYTNLDVSGFKTPIGYSGNFYGIRKYTGLVPNSPYNITITSKSGNNNAIKTPNEFIELDYGSNEYVNYSGIKFAADKFLTNDERQVGNKYGKAVAVKNDLIAIGAPMQTVSYSEYDSSGNLITTNLQEAGSVFLYRREPRPSGYDWPINDDKSDWNLETKLTLPSGLLRDYSTQVTRNSINGYTLPLSITETYWNVGQEGRQFGHSLDIGINNNISSFFEDNREILVVGGPSAKWSRQFEDLNISGVSIGLIVFTDEFAPTLLEDRSGTGSLTRTKTYRRILEQLQDKDFIFTYFCDPPVKFDVKLIICEPIASNTNTESLEFPEPKPQFIVKKKIPRNEGLITEEDNLAVFSGIKSAFDEAFPYDSGKLNNNIPTMLGIYVDNSRSLGRSAVAPGLDRFLSYYRNYSFDNGLIDFYGVRSSGAIFEYNASNAGSEDWIDLSITALNQLLDTGRLVRDNQVRFFASSIGEENFNTNLSQFNYPPNSGGRVYIFEKESGSWNLIQEIQSPVVSYDTIDRFGHSVAISEDTSIIGIGSPYINECCKIYEYKPNEKIRLFNGLYSWLPYKNSLLAGNDQRYLTLMEDYQKWLEDYGFGYANAVLYSKLTATEKFEARKYLGIQEYQNIFTYSYSDIPRISRSWKFIPELFAPSSRLGYSVAINDDGTTVAFGAPTDSFNVFDDWNIYYKNNGYKDPDNINNLNTTSEIIPYWRSNVNAGAVRLFESRKYYPHNKAVEFGKFGNLQQSLNDPLDSGHFNYLSSVFTDKNFRKMSEEEVAIPDDAGLAFVITPGEDAVSDEIIDNFIRWLSLGDRNLVLIGNDPVWESSGIYKKSNDIINKILDRLQSRMRLYPARNQYESLPSGSSSVIPSFRPAYGTETYILPFELNTASGVADIRMHFPPMGYQTMECPDPEIIKQLSEMGLPYIQVNERCELPISHNGDLRAQWRDFCMVKLPNGQEVPSIYYVNWPFKFRNYEPLQCVKDSDHMPGTYDLKNHDVIPLLAAAAETKASVTIPGKPAKYGFFPIYETKSLTQNRTVTEFVNDQLFTSASFKWDSSNPSGYTSYSTNLNNILNKTPWYTPTEFQNRKSLIQSSATPLTELVVSTQVVIDKALFCVEESYHSNETSKFIGIAGIESETQSFLYASPNDSNINFYVNLVSKSINGEANIAQLGGWTARTSFKDSISNSILKEIFLNTGNDVRENAITLSQLDDVCWISNPLGLPTENDIVNIKSWMNLGDKKLIITHDGTIDQILRLKKIFELLGSNIKPLYLNVKQEYSTVSNITGDVEGRPYSEFAINQNHPIANGFDKYRVLSIFVDGLTLSRFIPFDGGQGIVPIMYKNINIYDDKLLNVPYFRLNTGLDKITFPIIPGSGYKLFISAVSENASENIPIDIYLKNVSLLPRPESGDTFIEALQENTQSEIYRFQYNIRTKAETTLLNEIFTSTFNVQANENEIEIFINSVQPRLSDTPYIPRTCRLLSISGVLLPIKETVQSIGLQYSEIVGYENRLIDPEIPEQQIVLTQNKAISTLNNKYCSDLKDCESADFSNKFIEDGPIVAAQEISFIAGFNAGFARSRITVLSDSNLVQGRYMADEFGRLSQNTVSFIRSLYPETNFPSSNSGRQYTDFTKIVSPERGSPAKYLSVNNNNGLKQNFGAIGSQSSMSLFGDKESLYDPAYVLKKDEPWSEEDLPEDKEKKKQIAINQFIHSHLIYGTPKFSGIIDGKNYSDIGIDGGIPDIMKDTGFDYLDFERFPSGFPGDLFGYSVSLHKDKLVVGSPFNAFSNKDIKNWTYHINNSGLDIKTSYNGGAGSAYIFEKTFKGVGASNKALPWQFIQKLRPDNINIGQDITDSGSSQSYALLGPHPYNSGYLAQNSTTTDQFGYDVSIDSDIIAVGAPGHDFGKITNNIYDSGSFIRKAFNSEFDIPDRVITDLGNSGIRSNIGSGLCVLNNGAIFTFENSILDWSNRTQKWDFIEKIIPYGNSSREQNKNENDNFGKSVYVHRSMRSDADYVIIGGAENHNYSSSGTELINNAGAAYCNDIMLRESPPTLPSPNTYMDINVFGERTQNNEPTIRVRIGNSNLDTLFYNSGIIYSDKNGNIFLEVSGQDPSTRGFIQHRPSITSIDGLYFNGLDNSGILPLFINARNADVSGNVNLFVIASTGNVYNNLGLYTDSIVDFGSGILNFYTDCPDPTTIFESGLILTMASGIGISTENLNLRIRGY